MALSFRNDTPYTAYIALGFRDPNCSDGWSKAGWWTVEPGRETVVKSIDTRNLSFLYYAEDTSGVRWEGGYKTTVPQQKFDKCWIERCTPCREVGFIMERVSSNFSNYRINLRPPIR
ncbi:DUF1036 domain-containing protein [Brevibacillus laterosporus]|uniref:DUF1036 domain-containing protein n=1 Tax=Brevibacillus laterosporus TaxID=1465 RepID=UPI0035A5C0D7